MPLLFLLGLAAVLMASQSKASGTPPQAVATDGYGRPPLQTASTASTGLPGPVPATAGGPFATVTANSPSPVGKAFRELFTSATGKPSSGSSGAGVRGKDFADYQAEDAKVQTPGPHGGL